MTETAKEKRDAWNERRREARACRPVRAQSTKPAAIYSREYNRRNKVRAHVEMDIATGKYKPSEIMKRNDIDYEDFKRIQNGKAPRIRK